MASKQFIRVVVKVPVDFFVGPIDVPVPNGVDPAEWDEEDIIEAARDIFEGAADSAMPDRNCQIQGYPIDHPLRDEWIPVRADLSVANDPEIAESEQVEHEA